MHDDVLSFVKEVWAAEGRKPSLNLVRAVWETAVGPDLAQHTRPVALTRQSLIVEVRSSWKSELERRHDELRRLAARRLPFDLPAFEFVASDDFAGANAPSVGSGSVRDARAEHLPDDTKAIAERLLWHVRRNQS